MANLQVLGVSGVKVFDEFESAIRKNLIGKEKKQIKIRGIETTIRLVEAYETSSCSQSAKSDTQKRKKKPFVS